MEETKEIAITGGSGDGGEETPSRYELLSMVRKYSNFLRGEIDDDQDVSNIGSDAKFWCEMMDLYFIRGRVLKGREEDDLVFFVRNMNLHGYGFNDVMESASPFFVQRWAPKLEKVLGEISAEIDWKSAFYLNLIAHTSFTVTVAICSNQALQRHSRGVDASLSPIYKGCINFLDVLRLCATKNNEEVEKTVYASPSHVNFHLDHKKAAETSPAYPNICFAVDDFDDTFDAVVLSERDHCYCVLLNANGGAAFPTENEIHDNKFSGNVITSSHSQGINPSKLTLFSGFVSYQMVREAYGAGRSRFGSLLSIGHNQEKTDKLYMRGPGGRGEVEVAVSGIADQSQQNMDPPSPPQLSNKAMGIDFGTLVQRAASAASVFAKHAYAATSTNIPSDEELLPLKCCLMSISLPWEYIAHDLLFKVTPPVNL